MREVHYIELSVVFHRFIFIIFTNSNTHIDNHVGNGTMTNEEKGHNCLFHQWEQQCMIVEQWPPAMTTMKNVRRGQHERGHDCPFQQLERI